MTTVGFGDYFPNTLPGKAVLLITCFSGIFIVSLTMVTLNNSKDYSKNEENTFTIIKRLIVRNHYQKEAKALIEAFIKFIKARS